MWTSQGLNLGPPDYESVKMWSSIIIISILKTLHLKVVEAVEVAVGDGFHDVGLADLDAALEVGDGAGYLEDAVVGSRAHVHAGDGLAQLGHALGVGLGVLVQQRGGHLSVAVHAGVVLEAEAFLMPISHAKTKDNVKNTQNRNCFTFFNVILFLLQK